VLRRLRPLLFAALLVPLGGWEPLWRLDPDVVEGNKAYEQKRYDDAVKAYERARENGVDKPGLEYDMGTALAAKGDLDKAIEHYVEAAKSTDAHLKAKAHFNRGNVRMKQKQLEAAIDAYKDALRADPTMESARINLELALRQREREKQQQQQQQGGQGQQGQQGQQGGDGQQQQQQQQGQGQGQQQQQQGQGQGQQGQGQQGQQQQQQQQGQGQGQGNQQGQQGNQGGSQANQTPQPNWPRDDTEYDTPDTPADQKFNELESMSRQQRRDQVRNHRSHGTSRYDYDKDW
jgi:tetratricopeptide (TPR) repeat protein